MMSVPALGSSRSTARPGTPPSAIDAFSTSSAVGPWMKTLAPCSRASLAVPNPTPDVEPVMTTTLPVSILRTFVFWLNDVTYTVRPAGRKNPPHSSRLRGPLRPRLALSGGRKPMADMFDGLVIPDLKGKRVLVTGASTGIGAAVAIAFAGLGARVAIHYNASEAAAKDV